MEVCDEAGTAVAVVPGAERLAPAAPGWVTPSLLNGLGLVRAGRVREATGVLTALRTAELPDGTEPPAARTTVVLAALVECRLARGELADAMGLGDALAAFLDLPGLPAAVALQARAEVSSALGEAEHAAEQALAAGALLAAGVPDLALDRAPLDIALVPWWSTAALALVRTGQRREAAGLATQWAEVAARSGSSYAVAHALRTLASVDLAGDRVDLLRHAEQALDGTGAQRLAAQIDTDLAGLLILEGRAEHAAEALTRLRAAEQYAGRQELWPLQGRVRRLLERVGEAPRPVQSEALAALTGAERRVAQLAADGLTNREIADHLVVTVKAVEWHLSHIYRKLGIRSRTRLASTLGASL